MTKSIMRNRVKYLMLFVAVIIAGCKDDAKNPTDTTTRGDVKIVVDESLQKLFKNQIYTFESLYPDAHIHVDYLPENEMLISLLNDSSKVAVMCRNIRPEERQHFEVKNIFPISTKIAEDAVAFIVNNKNENDALTIAQVHSILTGKDSVWSQINKTVPAEVINIVFDNKGSANTNYMKDSILTGLPFSENTFALNSNPEVIDYVSNHNNAIGLISVNWISDQDDSATIADLKKIKVLAIAKKKGDIAVKPYQAYIKTKEYPFTRNIYMINRQTRAGLGMGFVSFVAGKKGQLMILKSGLVPAIPPERFIEVKMN